MVGEKVLDAAQAKSIVQAWMTFTELSESLLESGGGTALLWSDDNKVEWANLVQTLGNQGLAHLVAGHMLDALERNFKSEIVPKFLQHFEEFPKLKIKARRSSDALTQLNNWVATSLPGALAEICAAKSSQEDCLSVLAQVFNFEFRRAGDAKVISKCTSAKSGVALFFHYQTTVNALLHVAAPKWMSGASKLLIGCRGFELVLQKSLGGVQRFSEKQQSIRSSNGNCDYEESENGEENRGSECGEDEDMESVPSSNRTSVYHEDMDLGVVGSQVGRQVVDDDTDFPMEGIEVLEASDLKARAGTDMYDVVQVVGADWVKEVGDVVRRLKELGFASKAEEGYASAIYSLLKAKIHSVATKRYEKPVLRGLKRWIETVPLRFLSVILACSVSVTSASVFNRTMRGSDDAANDGTVRWRSRLHSFADETLGDLRVSELFDIIVDFPESLAAIEDLKECLVNTGDHANLVDSFRDALEQRLLTAGAATTDILLQYISTIKALRTLDPTGVVLEAVGEPIKEYLRARKDTIRCIVTMLADDAGPGGSAGLGGVGESLLEELSRGPSTFENADSEDDGDVDGDEAWAAAERWEPDPLDANPSRTSKSRRLMDIISILVGIYGSKELFVNEYRVMLADKLLNKTDYDTDRNIRTLELLKIRFGDSNMHSCEIMLKDIADSKRINSNIKASISSNDPAVQHIRTRVPTTGNHDERNGTVTTGKIEQELSLDLVDATIISSLFWPPFQAETIKVPEAVELVLDEYSQRYHALKTPRKLQWKKHLGTVKLELQFEDRSSQFVVSPLHATIIMQFESQSRWLASDLAQAVGVPLATLRRRIVLWVNQGVLVESPGPIEGEWSYTIVENIGDGGNRTAVGPSGAADAAFPLLGEEEGESAVASMEDQWQQEMNVYESYVVGMLTNFESLPLDRIHNMLKMFVSDPPYDKSLSQLQGFLARLVSEEKLEFREGCYRRR